jgi:hypothetical protein
VALPLETLRRRRVRPLTSAYDFDALDSALKIQREMAAHLSALGRRAPPHRPCAEGDHLPTEQVITERLPCG